MTESRTVYSDRSSDDKVDIVSDAGVVEYYADGVASFQFGAPVSRLALYRVGLPNAAEPDVERREISVSIVMPTRSLLQLCYAVLRQASNARQEFEESFTSEIDAVKQLLAHFPESDRSHQ